MAGIGFREFEIGTGIGRVGGSVSESVFETVMKKELE
jgi:hypothetical protein